MDDEQQYTVTVVVTIKGSVADAHSVASDMEEAAAKLNAELEYTRIKDEDNEEIDDA